MILVDTNVLLDVLQDDPNWAAWSQAQLESAALTDSLAINAVIYSELSMAFERIEELEQIVAEAKLAVEAIPREALFLAGKVFLEYRRRKGSKQGVLPDFYIGAHAAVARCAILTRDVGRYRGYFPTVPLVTPKT
ncbi:MAG: type II toxin-antitoxin system VapC family toxin [Steroidobacteraceae bacterium]